MATAALGRASHDFTQRRILGAIYEDETMNEVQGVRLSDERTWEDSRVSFQAGRHYVEIVPRQREFWDSRLGQE
ncbi:hypothetical protein HCTV5_162 [Halovirus HCTV-5]|uniref:hypothetical protein n=1 Tax=Halovirus HCTV-5 TaxID=1273748 RepID=UPI000334837C|nr:hypothetical protein M200_gp068 [Halovirus HCTV-5]AGM11766.1 hypothetical protein HCTV5_162 [Halovirus HCTV-5]